MLTGVPNDYTTQDVIKLAQWLIAQNTHLMYREQNELTAKLQESQERNEHLVTANNKLQERLNSLTEAYATLVGDAMNLAEVKEHMPTPFSDSDPTWCAQATAAMCRSTLSSK
jgi:predicted nuclease with TOPRIM domain